MHESLVVRCVRYVPPIRTVVLVLSPIGIMLSFMFLSLYQERLSTAQFYRRLSSKMDITRIMAQLEGSDWTDEMKSSELMKNIESGLLDSRDVSVIRSQFIVVNNSQVPRAYLFVPPENRTEQKAGPPVPTNIVVETIQKTVGVDDSTGKKNTASERTLNYTRFDFGRYSFGRRPEVWNKSRFVQDQQTGFRCPIGLCFEPDIVPSTNGIPKIPRIIHQTWINSSVPEITVKWIKKWLEMNPGYQYWLWTDRGIDNFINTKYSKYKEVFKKYKKQIEIADAIRYFILYHYGGIYADLDMEPLQSFDPLVFSYPCLLSVEPDEHALLLRPQFSNQLHILTSNAIMMCRPKHAFFKHIISGLIARTFLGGTLWRTGPAGMAKDFQHYLSLKRNDLCERPDDRVALVSQELLLPQFDSREAMKVKQVCNTQRMAVKFLRPLVCKQLLKNDFRNDVTNNSFATHHWIHTWTPRGESLKKGGGLPFVPIKSIVPKVKLPYDGIVVPKNGQAEARPQKPKAL